VALRDRLLSWGLPERIARGLGRELGRGNEGVVFELGDSGTRVLKVNFTAKQSVRAIARRAKGRAWAARMFESGRMKGRGFWYVMERLYAIDSRSVRVLDDISRIRVAKGDGRITKERFDALYREILMSASGPLREVIRKAKRAGYSDLHGGNVMRTKSGTLKVVDLESLRKET
jgi:hypothetical protein